MLVFRTWLRFTSSLAVEDKGHKIFGFDISEQTLDDIKKRKIRYKEEWVDKLLPTKLIINNINDLVKNSGNNFCTNTNTMILNMRALQEFRKKE